MLDTIFTVTMIFVGGGLGIAFCTLLVLGAAFSRG